MILYQYFFPKKPKNKNVCLFRYIQCQLINAACSKLSYCREWCCSTLVNKHLSRNLSPFFFITLRKHMAVQERERQRKILYQTTTTTTTTGATRNAHKQISTKSSLYCIYIYTEWRGIISWVYMMLSFADV